MKPMWKTLGITLCLVVLVSCAPIASPGSGTAATPTQIVGYPAPGGTVVITPAGIATTYPVTPKPTGYPASGGSGTMPETNSVTLEQNGQTIRLPKDGTFLLKLGETYQWEIKIDPTDVISRIPNIAVIKGAQGIYKAIQPGTATLSATGDPLCRQSKPACMSPSIQFSAQIVVLP